MFVKIFFFIMSFLPLPLTSGVVWEVHFLPQGLRVPICEVKRSLPPHSFFQCFSYLGTGDASREELPAARLGRQMGNR